KVLARAETGERPDYWPENSNGYTTGFTVVARNEDEARQFALQYLRAIDPSPTIRFHLDIVPPQAANEQVSKVIELASMEPRAQGVAQIDRARSYNYSS